MKQIGFLVTAGVAIVLGTTLAACSSTPDPNQLRGAPTPTRGYPAPANDQPSKSSKAKPSGSSSSAPSGSSTPPPSSTTPPAPTPAPPPPASPAGSCGNPKCVGVQGLCGCVATDSNGDKVALGCSDGQCVCTKLDQVTDGPVDEGGACGDEQAMQALFVSTCTCQ